MSKLTRTLWTLLACYILLAPGLVQLGGVDIPEIRTWRMYGGVGLGVPYGVFAEKDESDQVIATTALINAMGYQRTAELQAYPGAARLKINRYFTLNDILVAGQDICNGLAPNHTLSFTGRIATAGRWLELQIDHARLCPKGDQRVQ